MNTLPKVTWFDKITTFLARLYLLAFILFSIKSFHFRIDAGIVMQILVIMGLVIFRLKSQSEIVFIPDLFLFSLPYFWAISLSSDVNQWFNTWNLLFLFIFSISVVNLLHSKLYQKIDKNILHGSALTIIFVLVFAIILRTIFPLFSAELFNRTLLNTIVFFCGIPICLISVRNY